MNVRENKTRANHVARSIHTKAWLAIVTQRKRKRRRCFKGAKMKIRFSVAIIVGFIVSSAANAQVLSDEAKDSITKFIVLEYGEYGARLEACGGTSAKELLDAALAIVNNTDYEASSTTRALLNAKKGELSRIGQIAGSEFCLPENLRAFRTNFEGGLNSFARETELLKK
jgi:hypothetical protein